MYASTETAFEVYPNPVTAFTTITFSLNQPENVTIRLFSIEGKEIGLIVDAYYAAGNHKVNFFNNFQSNTSASLAAGIYFIQFKTNKEMVTRKVILEGN
jgi:hypothetical protein